MMEKRAVEHTVEIVVIDQTKAVQIKAAKLRCMRILTVCAILKSTCLIDPVLRKYL